MDFFTKLVNLWFVCENVAGSGYGSGGQVEELLPSKYDLNEDVSKVWHKTVKRVKHPDKEADGQMWELFLENIELSNEDGETKIEEEIDFDFHEIHAVTQTVLKEELVHYGGYYDVPISDKMFHSLESGFDITDYSNFSDPK